MGGKAKQNQRIKNNARPSSSGRSADFLGSSNIHTFGDSGKSLIVKTALQGFPALETAIDESNTNIDPNIQVLLRKLTKKDAVTKKKALTDLSQVIQESEVEVVKAILPVWPRLYQTLAVDVDHKVRENCQQAHSSICSKLGKLIAPILKQIAPTWLASQYDLYAPAGNCANASFRNAFPDRKLKEVILYCHNEILEFILKTLSTQITIPNDKNLSPEDYENRYQRGVISVLNSYSFYLQMVDEENIKEKLDVHESLINHGKFWSYSKHQTSQIRASWFEVINNLLLKAPFLLENHQSKVIGAVIQTLDDTESVVLSFVWSCLLLVQKNDNWIQFVNIEKAFLVKIRKVTSESPLAIHPHLLPFISKIDSNILGKDTERFFVEFFDNMKSAIKRIKPGQKQEAKSLVTTFFECLQFIINKLKTQNNLLPKDFVKGFCINAFNNYILDVLEWTLNDNQSMGVFIYPNLNMMVTFWKNNSDLYSDYLRNFWAKLDELLEKGLEESTNAKSRLDNQLLLINHLTNKIKGAETTKKSVSFGKTDEITEQNKKVEILEKNNWPELTALCTTLCKLYFHQASIKKESIYLKSILRLLRDFGNKELVSNIFDLKSYDELEKDFLDWLKEEQLFNKDVVNLLLYLNSFQNESEQMKLFEILLNNDNNEIRRLTLEHTLQRKDEIRRNVLDLATTKSYIDNCALSLINEISEEENYNLLKVYFENITDIEHFQSIIEIICNSLETEKFVPLASKLLINLLDLLTESKELKVNIFLTLYSLSMDYDIDQEQRYEIKAAWMNAIEKGHIEINTSILGTCNDLMVQRFDKEIKKGDFNVETLTENLFDILFKYNSDHIEWQLETAFHIPALDSLRRYIEYTALFSQFLSGDLFVEDPSNYEYSENHSEKLKHGFKAASLRCQVLVKILQLEDTVVDKSRLLIQIIDSILFYSCGEMILKCNSEDSEIEDIINDLVEMVKTQLLTNLDEDLIKTILKELRNKADGMGIWSQCWLDMSRFYPIDYDATLETTINKMENLGLIQVCSSVIKAKSLPFNVADQCEELIIKCLYEKLMIKNHFSSNYNDVTDNIKIKHALSLLDSIMADVKSKKLNLLYNADAKAINCTNIALVTEIANMCRLMVVHFPTELGGLHWDFIRIALSSWILTMSKAIALISTMPQVPAFMNAVLGLFIELEDLFDRESAKSSTQMFSKVIEEWNTIFARDVNLVLMKLVMNLIKSNANKYILREILPKLKSINFKYLFLIKRVDPQTSFTDFVTFVVKNIKHENHIVRHTTMELFMKMIPGLLEFDVELLSKKNENDQSNNWNCLEKYFSEIFDEGFPSLTELVDYNFKAGDNEQTTPLLENSTVISFLFLWNCVCNVCSQSSSELRSIYANWITMNGRDDLVLKLIFKLLPDDVIKNFETRSPTVDAYFKNNDHLDLLNKNLNTDRLVCYMYLNLVRYLPAVVRKWWANLPHRPKLIVEKFHMFYAAQLLCHEELQSLMEKREKLDNMQIGIHSSTREIQAVYSIDEARMELLITLPLNYPLGVVKVDCGKQIGGRLQSRVVIMQLTLFLSHQNGTLWDGLSLWKRNLDKKYEGVEECYVCYSVIHQDTCQLPKLTCKTCRKKFHSPCLYRWFSSSNKSTCPICRNMF